MANVLNVHVADDNIDFTTDVFGKPQRYLLKHAVLTQIFNANNADTDENLVRIFNANWHVIAEAIRRKQGFTSNGSIVLDVNDF